MNRLHTAHFVPLLRLVCAAAAAWPLTHGAAAEPAPPCEQLPLSVPSLLQTVAEARPSLRWEGDPARTYRLQLAVVLPESRILAAHDVQVSGTEWRLPADVPASRAAIKALVSSNCPALGAQDLHARGAVFFVDRRVGCELGAHGLRRAQAGLAWQAVAGAQHYRVRWWRADGGTLPLLLGEQDLPAHQLAVSPAHAQAQVATVQPWCDGIGGVPAAVSWGTP
ncbi:hypothetical protein JI739_07405 [Ramlibacter sp. AW1]|uniref:Uncharacterized protein n=1 Tax=Ramlibacter aurantiacus TaxID=2801330 RepID=A0A937D6S4_9BURK|nr:hypothetical protein [Ramlibacter aurantiacus]MBL0420171.1 hypothetical protein [Ramlibacter aurantiacus]